MMKYILPLLTSYALFNTVQAASFNCERASGFVETTICKTAQLSSLDDKLKVAYNNALEKHRTNAKEQKLWLKTMRACTSAECISENYQQRLAQLNNEGASVTWQPYQNTKLGIKFNYSSDKLIKEEDNSISLVSKTTQGSDYSIHFEIGTGDFNKAVTNTAIFTETKKDQWVASIGRFENPPAEKITGHNWSGLKTIITCGIEDKETGFHAAAGQCLWALISNGKRYLLADTQGIEGLDENTLKTLTSIEFIE